MSQFLKQVLASLVGSVIALFVALFLFIVIIIGITTSAVMKATHEKKGMVVVKPNSVVKIDLNYEIPERTKDDIFANMNWRSFENEKKLGLTDILADIKKAKEDDNVKGIFLDMSSVPSGVATIQAIRDQLVDFKKGGKFIVAYGEVLTQKAYYLASVADKVYINPVGIVEFKGFSSELMFLKNLLDKLEIEPQIFYCGKFKSATEPLRFTQMSDANREQVTSYVNDVYQFFLKNIGESRKIDTKVLDSLASNLVVRTPEAAVSNKLVDSLLYYDRVLADIKSRVGAEKEKDIHFVSLDKYNDAAGKKKEHDGKDKIAVIYAQGNIVDGDGDEDNIGSNRFAKAIREIREDNDVKAIVLRINTGGGSALASDIILRELKLAKQNRPLIVSMGDVAASGGYYIACAADTILAQPNTITGSIGVFGIIPNMQGFFKDKLYLTFDGVKTGKFSDLGNLSRPLTDEEKIVIQAGVDTIYHTFKSRVADGRKRNIEYIDSIGQGRVWTGSQAKANGLVDAFGGLDDAIRIAAAKAGLKEYSTKDYPKNKAPFAKFFGNMDDEMSVYFTKKQMGDLYPMWKKMQDMKSMTGIQARVPFEIDIH